MESDLTVGISVCGFFIQCDGGKPLPLSISNEALALRAPFVVFLEGVPTLVAVTCRDVEIHNLENIAIHQIGGVAVIRVGLVWRGVSKLKN